MAVVLRRARIRLPFLASPRTSRRCFSTISSQQEDKIATSAAEDNPSITVDRSGLFNAPGVAQPCVNTGSIGRDAKHIKALIRFRGGPITISEYMEEVLTNPNAGFYMNRDVFGSCGDFVTSPDISQMFGEMVGVWSMCLWHKMGQPKQVRLIELGLGRGTLIADLLRGTAKFTDFSKTLSVRLVEFSPALKKSQHQTLKCTSKDEDATKSAKDSERSDLPAEPISQISGAHVSWHISLEQVPRGSGSRFGYFKEI